MRRLPPVDNAKANIVDKALEQAKVKAQEPKVVSDLSLDTILNRQLLALDRVTQQLTVRSSSGDMSKDEIQSLATCIKVTLDLKAKEKELIDELSYEELEEVSND